MTTLRDLSRHLGLSVTQISRALNGHGDVSAATRVRVTAAAAELGYAANITARRLQSGKSGIVAMVVAAEAEREIPDVLLSGVIGLSSAFARHGMQFVLRVVTEEESELAAHRSLVASGLIDGFVVVNPRPHDPRLALLGEMDVPFVVHGRDRSAPDYPFVDIDNRALAGTLTRHLIEAGHRRIALIDGPAGAAFAQERVEGFRAALAAAGFGTDGLILNGLMTELRGRHEVDRLFAAHADWPTGVVAGNMLLAKGIFAALADKGLAIPEVASVVAHDDCLALAPRAGFTPALTVTQSSLAQAWTPLAEALAGAISGTAQPTRQDLLAVTLVRGASVGPPRPCVSANNST